MFSKRGFLVFSIFAVTLISIFAWNYPAQAQRMITYDPNNPTVDDVLDEPDRFIGQQVTLEGELDDVYGSNSWVMEDDSGVFGEDHLLIISVMPGQQPEAREGEISEGKIVQATGTIRTFNSTELQTQFGQSDWGVPQDKLGEFEGQPVLIIGEAEFLASRQTPAPVVEPEPVPPQPEPAFEPTPEPLPPPAPEPVQPEPAPAPRVEEPEGLPKTATPLPLAGLLGLISLSLGFGIRLFRQ